MHLLGYLNARIIGRRVIVSVLVFVLFVYNFKSGFFVGNSVSENGISPDSTQSLVKNLLSSVPCPLISPKLVGWTNLSLEATTSFLKEDENAVELKMKEAGVKLGGRYEPNECQSRNKVAIIVPLRNRADHLKVFLRYMHPFLQRQQLSYTIIVVEQSERSAFNRGMLLNIGFKEAQSLEENFGCVILHDVDMLPEDDGNPYTCPEDGKPRQMAFCLDYWKNYKPVGWGFFGAVSAFSVNDFQRINGYSNSFWGWGGEDDLLYHRIVSEKLTATRTFGGESSPVLHYRSLFHEKAKPNPNRMRVMEEGKVRFKTDGLVDLRYTRLDLQYKPLYTHILVDILPYDTTL